MGTNFYGRIIPSKEKKSEIKQAIDNNEFDKIYSTWLYKCEYVDKLEENSPFKPLSEEELNKIKNPVNFYNKINKSQIAMDFGVWYKEVDSGDNISYGAFATSQEMFNQMLVELDIF